MRNCERFWELQNQLEEKRMEIERVKRERAEVQAEMSKLLKSVPNKWFFKELGGTDAAVPE